MIRTNKKMRQLLKGIELKSLEENFPLPRNIQTLAENVFLDANDCILLQELAEQGKFVQLEDFPDKTGYECFVNKFHVEDYLAKSVFSQQDLLKHAMAFAYKLEGTLLAKYSDISFELVISIQKLSCVAYLHIIRENEAWVAQDIESYRSEGVLVMSI